MHIGWNRIWKVLLGCACVIGSIVLLACGQVGWGIAALEAAVLLLALQYAPRAARLRKTWWFVELVLVLAVTVGYAGFAAVRAAQTPASAQVLERLLQDPDKLADDLLLLTKALQNLSDDLRRGSKADGKGEVDA